MNRIIAPGGAAPAVSKDTPTLRVAAMFTSPMLALSPLARVLIARNRRSESIALIRRALRGLC